MDKQTLDVEIKQAMRDKDRLRLSILRLVKNEVDAKEKETGQEASEAEVTSQLKKILKQTTETLEASEKAATDDTRTDNLQAQVDILAGYLPAQVSGPELEAIADRVIAENGFSEKRDMGRAIALVAEETGGNVDKAEVARLVGARLG